MEKKNWYSLTAEETIKTLSSSLQGLSREEVQRRLAQFGPNELVEKKGVAAWMMFLGQFKSFLIIILLVAVVLSAIRGEVGNAIVILAIVVFATLLGFVQEYRAERAMDALKKMAAPTATVLRDGRETEVPARELVPGDIFLLSTGDRIPADARLVQAINLKTDEAPLTGESIPVEKTTATLAGELNVGERENMVFAGTVVVYGRGMAIVTATGMTTEFGKIAAMLQGVKAEETPLQANLDRIGKWIGIGALVLSFVLAGVGIWRGQGVTEMFLWGVSLAVAVVPEALPAVVTICLSLGVRRMLRRHALVRKMAAVETLGCTTFICSDKTGTLTQNQMTVRRLHVGGRFIDVTGIGYEPKGEFHHDGISLNPGQSTALQVLLRISAQCNDASLASLNNVWHINGDPTEGALVTLAAKAGLWQQDLNKQFPRLQEIPFSSETKRMTTIHQTPAGGVAYSKGAPESILDSCSHIYVDDQERELTREGKDSILSIAQVMAGEALRVLGMAYKRLPDAEAGGTVERDMVFVGLIGMIDPPREEVRDAIKLCDEAGIKSVMITGDHKLTAVAIAKELGLLKGGVVLSGTELDGLSDTEFESLVEKIEVYARVSAAHKLRVVGALHKRGHVVAMTGDGVNDAPALKQADIGVAMGITGTDVTKEAAVMVLTDDNFASIVAAVEEGRGVVDNIKKYLMYLFSGNMGEVLALAIALLAGTRLGLKASDLPLVAAQILFINLIGDGLAAVALAVDPPTPDLMKRRPLQLKDVMFSRSVLGFTVGSAIWTGGVTLGSFLWAIHSGRSLVEAQCICFVTLLLTRLVHAFNSRSEKRSLFEIGPFTNRWLWAAVGLSLLLTTLVIYVPPLQSLFNTFSMTAKDWGVCLGFALTILVVVEVAKALRRWRERRLS